MTATLTHVVFRVTGEPLQLAAFNARLKLLFAEHGIADGVDEQHAADLLHYDLKVAGGIPFPPFALASADFPELAVAVEWVDTGSGVRGSATIARGALTAQNVENIAAAGPGHQIAINTNADGSLALAVAMVRTGRDECRGYVLTGTEDALFRITRDAAADLIELTTTERTAEWSRAWRIPRDAAPEYRAIDPPQTIPAADFQELEKLAQDFVAHWIWFGNGPREEIAIETERYERAGYVIKDANLRSAALHRINKSADKTATGIHYSTLGPDLAWVETTLARCWPRVRSA